MIALIEAVREKLITDAPLTALLATKAYGGGITIPAVFDHVPQTQDGAINTEFPYLRIGSFVRDENDTDTELGFVGSLTIHTWSRFRGMQEAENVMDKIYDCLHFQALTVTGFGVSTIHQEFAEVLTDSDGLTRHGVQRFRIILEKTTS